MSPHIRLPARMRPYSSLTTLPKTSTQIYLSRSRSPYLNLSIEHYLLQKSPPHSTILFLYSNAPSIIIGRNQNPWVEVNLQLLRNSALNPDLVRRRSGGGTVWHDEGNVNYSVICPAGLFDRDKHAQMVVRALLKCGVKDVSVNKRHDIVVDSRTGPLKVSGSAYKLTRLRSVHHGTCLLNSPHLKEIGMFLKSPAKKYIKARGVDSVSSPITNVDIRNEDFEREVIREFGEMYEEVDSIIVGDEEGSVPEIEKGLKELTSKDWIYGQTPQFNFSYPSPPPAEETSEPEYPPMNISFTARNAVVTKSQLKLSDLSPDASDFNDMKLQDIQDWTPYIMQNQHHGATKEPMRLKLKDIAQNMNTMFGIDQK